MAIPKKLYRPDRDRVFVIVDGKRVTLGPPGPATDRKYAELVARLRASWAGGPCDLATLLLQYVGWAREYYDDREVGHFIAAIRLLKPWGAISPDQFGPLLLRQARDAMIKAGWSRPYCNHQVQRVRRIFKWGVSREMVRPETLAGLQSIEPLRKGKTDAPDTEDRQPVPEADRLATIPELSPTVAAMVAVHFATGCRPENVCRMRPREVQTTGEVWMWRPERHKTQWRGAALVMFLGPQAQQALAGRMDRPDVWCFSPRDAVREGGRTPPKSIREVYSVASYRQAIRRACERAGVPLWTPYQLRHARATEVRQRFGLEAAQAVLGHESLDATQIYAAARLDLARQVALETG